MDRDELQKIFPILKWFSYDHLPEKLQAASRPFCELAFEVAGGNTRGAETSTTLRKLLEAKDAYVRAVLGEEKP